MRGFIAIALLTVSLAGCTEEPADADGVDLGATVDLAAFAGLDKLALLEGVVAFHAENSGNPALDAAIQSYNTATQAVVRPCLLDGSPYFNNAHVSAQIDHANVADGTGAFEVTVSWTALDYTGESLYLAYAGGNSSYRISDALVNGQTTTVEVKPSLWEGSGDAPLDLWLCMQKDGDGVTVLDEESVEPFHGNVNLKVDLIPVAVDSAGSAYVTGSTISTNFPVTAGSFDTTSSSG